MKGRSSNTPRTNDRDCYAIGGGVRDLGGGIKAKPYGSNAHVEAEAKRGDTKIAGDDGGIDGFSAATRLDRPGRKNGGKLTTADRKHIAPKNFALPGRRYPIEDASHARNALSRVSANGSPEEKAKVRAAVNAKYPGIGKD